MCGLSALLGRLDLSACWLLGLSETGVPGHLANVLCFIVGWLQLTQMLTL